MSGLQSPQILTDLYRDLRDRRLLPLVLVLVVGMAVVPIALSSSANPVPPTPLPPAPTGAKANTPSQPIVVSNPGLRDYQSRLGGDSPKDPFVQEFLSPIGGPVGASDTGSAGSDAGTTGTTTPTGTGTSGGSSQPQTQSKIYHWRVKVRAGEVGKELKTHDGLTTLEPLPNKAVPAVSFLGVATDSSFNPEAALFVVSSEVSSLEGDGCKPGVSFCEVIALKPGQHEDMVWTNGLVYRIQVLSFHLVTHNLSASSGGNSGSDGGNSGSGSPVGRYFSF